MRRREFIAALGSTAAWPVVARRRRISADDETRTWHQASVCGARYYDLNTTRITCLTCNAVFHIGCENAVPALRRGLCGEIEAAPCVLILPRHAGLWLALRAGKLVQD